MNAIKDLQKLEAEQTKVDNLGTKTLMPHFHRLAVLAVQAAGNDLIGAEAYFVYFAGRAEKSILKHPEVKAILLKPEYGFTEKRLNEAKISDLYPSWNKYKSIVKAGFSAFGTGDDRVPPVDPRAFKDGAKFGEAIREHAKERTRERGQGGNEEWPEDFRTEYKVLNSHLAKFTNPAQLSADVVPLFKELNAKLARLLAPVQTPSAGGKMMQNGRSTGTTGEVDAPSRNAA